jgi:dTDP-4-dehydrorhamnose reductase
MTGTTSARPLELWVGAECTINRVDDRWRDQSELTGFAHRADDLQRLASIGAARVRLPVLWERLAAVPGRALDFSWPDRAIDQARTAGLLPILGLLHHGSGPRHTSLVDPCFPALFADYARRVAERYPDETAWTPINEPLTTARFSCLYGVWYPHAEDDRSFVRALLNQVRATVLAMREIRQVNPLAQLIQTDDLGFTRSTPGLVDQAAFDNERRWLAFDLLCGRVDERHPLRDWLCGCGASSKELDALCEAPCAPDVLGINAYITSERFLDERLELHPPHLHGGNGRQAYVDVETVRVDGALVDGFGGRLREAHGRYGLPLAITEVHLGCTREEQLRWLYQAWRAAEDARRDGVDVRGVTAWAAFGTVDWNTLLAEETGHYEPGLWDVRCQPPRQTALARLAATLARDGAARAADEHPILAGPGWWQRDLRLGAASHGEPVALPARGAPLAIAGSGALALAFARLAHMRGLPYEMLQDAHALGADALGRWLAARGAWAVVDATGGGASLQLASACASQGSRLMCVCTDAMSDGALSNAAPHALIVRPGALFGPWHADDVVASAPGSATTYVPDLVQAALDLLIDAERGVWQLNNGVAGDAHRTLLPTLDDALARYQRDHESVPTPPPPLRSATHTVELKARSGAHHGR